jgi:hypothetical protein
VHDYLSYNPSRDQILSGREYDRRRKNPGGIQTESARNPDEIATQFSTHYSDRVAERNEGASVGLLEGPAEIQTLPTKRSQSGHRGVALQAHLEGISARNPNGVPAESTCQIPSPIDPVPHRDLSCAKAQSAVSPRGDDEIISHFYNALQDALGYEPRTKNEITQWRTAITQLCEARASPDQIALAIASCKRIWPGIKKIKPITLASNWGLLSSSMSSFTGKSPDEWETDDEVARRLDLPDDYDPSQRAGLIALQRRRKGNSHRQRKYREAS